MVKVYVKYNNNLLSNVKIKGHAAYDILGKDIVCASISSIVITTINALLRIDSDCIDYTSDDGLINIKVIKNDNLVNILIGNMVDLLKELENNYKKNIKIIEEV